jgi:hypothetical protein
MLLSMDLFSKDDIRIARHRAQKLFGSVLKFSLTLIPLGAFLGFLSAYYGFGLISFRSLGSIMPILAIMVIFGAPSVLVLIAAYKYSANNPAWKHDLMGAILYVVFMFGFISFLLLPSFLLSLF